MFSMLADACLSLTGKMGCDEKERCAKKGKGDSQSAFSLDLRDDPGCDRGMLCFCQGQQDEMLKQTIMTRKISFRIKTDLSRTI